MKYLIPFLLLLATPTFAATTGTLVLTGIIAKKVEITVTGKPAASALDLETTQTDLSVATLTGKSNVNAGYKINVASANLGKLVHSSAPSNYVTYTLKIDSTSINLATGGFGSYSGMGTYTKDVKISYTGIDGYTVQDGTYGDTLTFTIAAN